MSLFVDIHKSVLERLWAGQGDKQTGRHRVVGQAWECGREADKQTSRRGWGSSSAGRQADRQVGGRGAKTVLKEGRKKGRKEGRKKGRKEEREEGRKERRTHSDLFERSTIKEGTATPSFLRCFIRIVAKVTEGE